MIPFDLLQIESLTDDFLVADEIEIRALTQNIGDHEEQHVITAILLDFGHFGQEFRLTLEE